MKKKVGVIGSGFAGLSAACFLSKEGYEVHVFEKNETIGGRARVFEEKGFLFDMGPSWYWMPDVFENFFEKFGYKTSDFYDLKLLEPAFSVVYEGGKTLQIPSNFEELCSLFESIEKGSAIKLEKFMEEAEYKYNVGINSLVYKPGLSLLEFADANLIKGMFRLQVFNSFSAHVRKYFSHPKLIALMEFPVLFLGAMPEKTPALYSLMNYAGLKLKTWYPMGGFGEVINAMKSIAEKQGAKFHTSSVVSSIEVKTNSAVAIKTNNFLVDLDAVISTADYHFTEQKLLKKEYRNYTANYWNKKTFAPSALIFYLGVNKKIEGLNHHTLFFDEDLKKHSEDIYKNKKWPQKPLFYVCCPSKTDPKVAPEGHENIFILMPIAAGIEDSEQIREEYFKIIMLRLEKYLSTDIQSSLVYKKSYCVSDFISDYNAFEGNAYGLANTLNQTAILKPKIINKKVKNLFYAGQLTVPGPGVPPAIISGEVVANELIKYFNTN